MVGIIGLGYIVIEAKDLEAWERFAIDLLGLQVADRAPDRLTFRVDEKAYRIEVRRGDADAVTGLGWEVKGAAELEEIAGRLESAGYVVQREEEKAAQGRLVSGLLGFDDPGGLRIEIFYGLKEERAPFVSPTGARFVTGTGGLGHVFQLVPDEAAFTALYQDVFGFRLSDYIEFGPAAAIFLHTNPRHHSYAYAEVSSLPSQVGHLMLEVVDLDTVGRAWDKARDEGYAITLELGRHTNDEMFSFYVRTPSGFEIEYGHGGKLIDESTWAPARYDAPSYWGHRMTENVAPDQIPV